MAPSGVGLGLGKDKARYLCARERERERERREGVLRVGVEGKQEKTLEEEFFSFFLSLSFFLAVAEGMLWPPVG